MLGRRTFTFACAGSSPTDLRCQRKTGIPLEINLNGVHYGKHEYRISTTDPASTETAYAYPFRKFWEIAAAMRCPVCYGWDAHAPLVLQDFSRVAVAEKLLEGLPLNFIDRSPVE